MNNLYTFLIDTDQIKNDNTFSVSARTYKDAVINLLDEIKVLNFKYLNVVLVYTNDIEIKEFTYESND